MNSAFDDTRAKKSDELSFRAERALAKGETAHAEELFAQAAELETELAYSVLSHEPRVRSVLAISAVALWLKARRFRECERYAHRFLADDNLLTDQGRGDLRLLLERCWREMDADELSKEAIDLVPIEMKLDGGRVRRGLAPSAIVRDRQQTLSSMLVRTAEWKMNRPFRERGEARKDVLERAAVYEAPAVAASYGVRLYVGSVSRMPRSPEEISSTTIVRAFLELAELAQTSVLESVSDGNYRSAFLAGFRDLAPDGVAVEVVAYSTPALHLRAPSSVFGAGDRERLSAALTHDHSEDTFEVAGILKVINLKNQFILIEPGASEQSVQLSIEPEKFDDTIGPKLNRKVRVLAERRKDRPGKAKAFALDVLTVDEQENGATSGGV